MTVAQQVRERRRLSGAQEAAEQAASELQQGNLQQAEESEREVEQELRQTRDRLEEEEEQYQELRQEELLFQIAEEVDQMLTTHREQMTATREAHLGRAGAARVDRRTRVKLRAIAREEEALGLRAEEIAEKLEEEGVMVFHEIVRNVESDLVRVARDMGETGGYQSGDRVQALQEDVENSLEWLEEALKDEMQRREQEQEEQEQQDQGDQQQSPTPLVPDVAELKLLRRMEVDLLEQLDQIRDLHPELADPDHEPDPLLMEELSRLAYKHRRVAELFREFRRRLGVPEPVGDGTGGED